MDEILIEEKKYISSKRAAKLTGYAKDYVGQLCREGRVPARLVGRSWYVLETAMQDHRFGNPEPEVKPKLESSNKPIFPATWEPPRYEATDREALPMLKKENSSIQDSWKAWFDRFETAETTVDAEKGVNIPIHTIEPIRQKPIEKSPEVVEFVIKKERKKDKSRVFKNIVAALLGFIAMITTAVAVVGSGYLDKYIVSISQVMYISGIVIYNK